MNNQLPFFMPMYPNNNQINNELNEKLLILEKRVAKLEERLNNLEKTKITKLKNNYDSFKEGYII